MRTKPTCRRCGRQHYNMESCAVAVPPAQVRRHRDTDVGNRLTTLVEIAPGVTGRARRAHVGAGS